MVQGRNSGDPVTGSWGTKAHRCTWGVKAGPCGLIPQIAEEFNAGPDSRYQNTQCIAVCCVWGCIAAGQSGCPC